MKHPMDETITQALASVDQLTYIASTCLAEGQEAKAKNVPEAEWKTYFEQAHQITTSVNSLLLGVLIYVLVANPPSGALVDELFQQAPDITQ